MDSNVKIVSATKLSEKIFWEKSFLGISLSNFPESTKLTYDIYFENEGKYVKGLSEIYNNSINRADANDILIFVHDDVYMHDWFLSKRVNDGLRNFDIIGVAGSYGTELNQPSWALEFDDEFFRIGWQKKTKFSGAVNHFDYCCPSPSDYGQSPHQCELMDGVFLSAKVNTLKDNHLTFDEGFKFHCYDIDFCRSAIGKGLKLGTWPISITHNSGGAFNSDEFRQSAKIYTNKWRK